MRAAKVAVFLLCLAPLGLLGWHAMHGGLGANPVEFVTHATGDWTMRFLIFTLMVTPARKLAGLPVLIRFRRMLGLFAFFYGCLHFLTYLVMDKFFDFPEMVHDIAKRPFITVGFAAFVMLVPLAITSTAGWIRRLGGQNWRALHRLVYASAVAGVIHYWWLVKSDIRWPLFYGMLVAVLLAFRVWTALAKRARPSRAVATVRSV